MATTERRDWPALQLRVLLGFMESTYLAEAERAGWDVGELHHPLAASPLGR